MDHLGRFVTKREMIETVNEISRRDPRTLYVVKFDRSVPKCLSCGRKSRKWTKGQDTFCPCGGQIEYEKSVEAMIRSMGEEKFMYFEQGVAMKCCLTDNVRSIEVPYGNNVLELFPVKC